MEPLLKALYPLSLLYRIGVETRLYLYRKGLLPTLDPGIRVLSVGNITVGGSGKTPLTMYLAETLSSWGYRVAILTRGYKGKGRGMVKLVSHGQGPLLSPLEAGDEPYLMASRLRGIPVIAGRDRYTLAVYAKENFDSQIVILDDGFQHLRLKRDLDLLILTRDALERPFLLPSGRLREPLKEMERAHIILLKERGWSVETEKPCFTFSYRVTALRDREGRSLDPAGFDGARVFAFCGIADPDSFISTLKGQRFVITDWIAFPDHHHYSGRDVKRIREGSRGADLVVTTEKDMVKVKDLIDLSNLYALEIGMDMDEEEAFREILKKGLHLP